MIKNFEASEKKYCEGFFSTRAGHYLFGINLSVAKVERKFSSQGSDILDQVNSFDLAEVSGLNMGQINMMNVSSFCGPKGRIWGLDICRTKLEENRWGITKAEGNIEIYDLNNLIIALKGLYGTIEAPKFPLLPGSHVPCASRYIFSNGPSMIYSSLALGIPKDRNRNACLIMEDVGTLHQATNSAPKEKSIVENLIASILQIGENQHYSFSKIFVGLKSLPVNENEVGCALIACPYFLIAKDAIIKGRDMFDMEFSTWEGLMNATKLSNK